MVVEIFRAAQRRSKSKLNIPFTLACEQALRGALAVGREKEGELATTSLELEFHLQLPCGSPSTELSDFCQSARGIQIPLVSFLKAKNT